MTKFNKDMKRKAINAFFAKRGQRMTNVSKVKLDKLDEIIKTHSIDVVSILNEIDAEQKLKDERKEQERNERLEKETEWLRKWNELNEEQKMNYVNSFIDTCNEKRSQEALKWQKSLHKNGMDLELDEMDNTVLRRGRLTVHLGFHTPTFTEVMQHPYTYLDDLTL